MAILHGSWVVEAHSHPLSDPSVVGAIAPVGYFLIWGEVWRRVDPVSPAGADLLVHPFAMLPEELLTFLRSLHQSKQLTWAIADVPLAAEPAPSPGRGKRKAVAAAEITLPAERWRAIALSVPTHRLTNPDTDATGLLPQHSAAAVESWQSEDEAAAADLLLHPWQVGGIVLSPLEAVQFLNSLPLSSVGDDELYLGGDLRFWSHVARWNLDLLARSKFIPMLDRAVGATERLEGRPEGRAEGSEGRGLAQWRALVDSAIDQARLQQFARRMPSSCRTYQALPVSNQDLPSQGLSNQDLPSQDAPSQDAPSQDLPGQDAPNQGLPGQDFPDVRSLLFSVLHSITEAQVRPAAATHALPATQFPKDLPLREWLHALSGDALLQDDAERLNHLAVALSNWLTPIQRQLSQQDAPFRACFHLKPPAIASQKDWSLDYCLQATDDPDVLVDARTIWSNPVDRLVYAGHTIDQPQETLLAGLGLASRLYPLLEQTLEQKQPAACILNPGQVYEFIKGTAWRLQDNGFGVVLPPSLASQQGLASRLGLSIRAETPSRTKTQRLGLQSLLNFKWELTIGGQRISKDEFDRLVALNTPLVEINGEWVELRAQDVRAAQSFFESRKDQMALSLEDALRISTGDTQMIEKLPVLNFEASGALHDLITTLTTGNQTVEAIAVPDSFQGELRPYQLRGASWLVFLQRWGLGACLADDMGLGKTIQFIVLMLYLQAQKVLDKPTLLVCPTSVLGNWEREVKRFAPTLKVLVHHGDKRAQGKGFAQTVKDCQLVITSYTLVYRDEKELKSVSWQGLVLDEAQNIKNADAKQSQAVRQLDAEFRIALTGTPVENRLSELWSILDFLNPGYLGPRNFFQRRFAVPIERYGDTDSLKTLRSLVQPFILRRLKTDRSIIQDLPEKQEMTVFCGLSPEQAALYQQQVDQSLVQIESAEGIQRKGMILALLTRLKQICNHPVLLRAEAADDSEAVSETVPKTVREAAPEKVRETARETSGDTILVPDSHGFGSMSGKLQRLSEMLDEVLAEGDRALIFTQFAEWGKLLKRYLEQQFSREVLYLYGGTSQKQREAMIDRFQNDPQAPRVFILSLKAGGVGLNLTRANHVFHFDRWWNPAVENQATDRVFRIGQTRNVQVHKFVCTGTLEERIHELIESKKALSDQVVGAGENWLTELDSDQLRSLLLLDRAAVIDDGE